MVLVLLMVNVVGIWFTGVVGLLRVDDVLGQLVIVLEVMRSDGQLALSIGLLV